MTVRGVTWWVVGAEDGGGRPGPGDAGDGARTHAGRGRGHDDRLAA